MDNATNLEISDMRIVAGRVIVLSLDICSLVISLIEIASIRILRRCVLTTDQIKFIMTNLLLADVCYQMTNIVIPISIIELVESRVSMPLARFKLNVLYVFALLYCMLIVIATIDRLVSIRYPVPIGRIVTPVRAKRVVITSWIIILAALLVPISISAIVNCALARDSCHNDLRSSRVFRMVISVCLMFCDLVVIISYILILIVANEQIGKLRHQYPGSRMRTAMPAKRIMAIVGTFVLLYSPFVIFTVVNDIFGKHISEDVFAMFFMLMRICNATHSCISMYYYLYSMPECRMLLMRTFSPYIRQCRRQEAALKVEIFNIPLKQRQVSPYI